jgi:hypothetical protein
MSSVYCPISPVDVAAKTRRSPVSRFVSSSVGFASAGSLPFRSMSVSPVDQVPPGGVAYGVELSSTPPSLAGAAEASTAAATSPTANAMSERVNPASFV